ncbi:MAG: hypothetical protein ABII02_00350 [Candidatus Magasanikbacteria bacterium]
MNWLEDAQQRNRQELVLAYTDKLIELVKNTSYTEALAERKHRLTGN